MLKYPDLKRCWGVTEQVTDVRLFFEALNSFTDSELILYLENVYASEPIYEFLQSYKIQTSEELEIGALNPVPERLFHIPLSERILYELTTQMKRDKFHVDHVALYKDRNIVFSYCDAFMRHSVITVSQELGLHSSQNFCNMLGVSQRESREAWPEEYEL